MLEKLSTLPSILQYDFWCAITRHTMVHHYIIIRSRICYTANPSLLVVSLSVLLSSFVVALTLRSAATINSFYRKLRQQESNWYVKLLSRKFFIYHANIGIKVMHIVQFSTSFKLHPTCINEQPVVISFWKWKNGTRDYCWM